MYWGECFRYWNPFRGMQIQGIKATIRDRYFNSACATPASVFPVLMKLKNSHMKKLETGERTGRKVYYERLLNRIWLENWMSIRNGWLWKSRENLFWVIIIRRRKDMKESEGGKNR